MGTCSETICKHRILFPSIQHLAWLPQGRPQRKQKCGKIAIFGLTHWLKHRKTRKLLKIDRYMLPGVWQALNCLSIHATYCVIVAGASQGETKMWVAVRENGDFFALAVRITGKPLKIDGYMLRGVWQALNCLFIRATFCVIAAGTSPGQTKNEGRGT